LLVHYDEGDSYDVVATNSDDVTVLCAQCEVGPAEHMQLAAPKKMKLESVKKEVDAIDHQANNAAMAATLALHNTAASAGGLQVKQEAVKQEVKQEAVKQEVKQEAVKQEGGTSHGANNSAMLACVLSHQLRPLALCAACSKKRESSETAPGGGQHSTKRSRFL
jgi:hypothetical protein